jgi:ribosomal protein RSM22 (predicted rRNA methylase)
MTAFLDQQELHSARFLKRSIVPHFIRLSDQFNRLSSETTLGLDSYWEDVKNPQNLRLAYFLGFMPCNAYRIAHIFHELTRLGFNGFQTTEKLRILDYGAGPATASIGLLSALEQKSFFASSSLEFSLVEQDKALLQLGLQWAAFFAQKTDLSTQWKGFHKKIQLKSPLDPLLNPASPRFDIWMISFMINELFSQFQTFAQNDEHACELAANALIQGWDEHLSTEGLVVIVEPALKTQSRQLLQIRKKLLESERFLSAYQILTPCLGHQNCGALSSAEDWCHEEISFMRPSFLKKLDELTGLDHKSLNFSYLVVIKSRKKRSEILTQLNMPAVRLVSPARKQQRDWEFFLCTPEGKRRARLARSKANLERGSILLDASLRGEKNATRVDEIKKLI